jgi:hypothetical protein
VFLAFRSRDKGFKSLIRTLWGVLKWEHTKKLGGFMQIGVSIKVDWVGNFYDFAITTLTSTLSETTWLGWGGEYLSIESILV